MGYDAIEKAARGEVAKISPDCPICGDPLDRASVVVCLSCSSPHHDTCWEFNKGCSTYACGCRVYAVPEVGEAAEDEAPLVFQRGVSPQFLVGWHLGLVGVIPAMILLSAIGLEAAAPLLIGTWMLVFLGAFLGAYGVRYTLDPENQLMTRQVKLLGIPTPWKEEIPFSRIQALTVRSFTPYFSHLQLKHQQQGPYGVPQQVQLIMQDDQGQEYLVDSQQNERVYRMLWQAERAAEALQTVVRMEKEFFPLARPRPALMSTLRELPPGEKDGQKLLP